MAVTRLTHSSVSIVIAVLVRLEAPGVEPLQFVDLRETLRYHDRRRVD